MHINVVVNMNVMMAMLLLNNRNVHDLFLCHGYWHIHDLLDWLVYDPLLRNDFRNVYDLLLGHWHVDINVMVNMNMMVTMLLLYYWNMHDLLNRHGHWHIHECLNHLLLNSSLLHNLRNMDDLFDYLFHGFMHHLVDFLYGLAHLHLRYFVDRFHNLHGTEFLHLLFRRAYNSMLLINVNELRRHVLLCGLTGGILRRCDFMSLHRRWVVDLKCGLLVDLLVHARLSNLLHDATIDWWIHFTWSLWRWGHHLHLCSLLHHHLRYDLLLHGHLWCGICNRHGWVNCRCNRS